MDISYIIERSDRVIVKRMKTLVKTFRIFKMSCVGKRFNYRCCPCLSGYFGVFLCISTIHILSLSPSFLSFSLWPLSRV